jgi:hypothetical protein
MYLGAARQILVQAKTPQQERTATLHSVLTTRFPTLGCLLHDARAVSDSLVFSSAMGASESKLVFKQGIFRLSEEKEIPADDPYWTRVCQ